MLETIEQTQDIAHLGGHDRPVDDHRRGGKLDGRLTMNRIKTTIAAVLLVCSLTVFVTTGCKSTLEPGGAYAPITLTTNINGTITTNVAPDKAFLIVDSAYEFAHKAVDGAFAFEKNNRLMLWQLDPQIKLTLDAIRPRALAISDGYLQAREVYQARKTPEQLKLLKLAVRDLEAVARQLQAALPK